MSSPEQENPGKEVWIDITTSSEQDTSDVVVRDEHELTLDEPWWVPIGNDTAPCPADYLLTATAGCQVEVLKQCFEKARVEDYSIRMHVERGERVSERDVPDIYPDHLDKRYKGIEMELSVETTDEFHDRVKRCLDVCEDACSISRNVEAGIPINLSKSLSSSP